MTIIDTTLYADGALRLSRHGAGRGDTVLMRTDATGYQFTVPDADTDELRAAVETCWRRSDDIQHVWDDLVLGFSDIITDYAPR